MNLKLLSLVGALALLGACSSTPSGSGSTAGTGYGSGSGSGSGSVASGPVAGSQEDLVASAGDRVFFDFDKSDIKSDGRETLKKQATWLATNSSVKVTIEGHCDERGTREYNLALGERRASAVKTYLVSLGVDAGRLATISYGKERPEVVGSNEDAWAKNRRAVTLVTSGPRS